MAELFERTGAGRVHVVRHSFEPSTPLAELIETFAGPYLRPRFLLRSTKEVYVDSVTFTRGGYREEDEAVHAAIEKAKRFPILIAKAALRPIYSRPVDGDLESSRPIAYRMGFLPADTKAFDELASSLDAYPTIRQSPAVSVHHLLLDLPVDTLRLPDLPDREGAVKEAIRGGIERRLFSATIAGIRSIEVPMRPLVTASVRQPDDQSA